MDERDTVGVRRGTGASRHSRRHLILAVAAAAFGMATIASGGRVLFGGPSARAGAGAYVGFVVAYNFAAGFAYLAAAAGLALLRRWSVTVALAVAAGTAVVFALFGAHAAVGGAFERRTVVAMSLRTAFWIAFAFGAARLVPPSTRGGRSADGGGSPRGSPGRVEPSDSRWRGRT